MDDDSGLTLDALWDRLNDEFLILYGHILRNTATVRWYTQHSDNEFFPLRALASFERVGRDDGEDLVIDIDIHRDEGRVTWTSDACQSSGLVLAEGPTVSAGEDVPLSSWTRSALEHTVIWLRAETPHFVAYLNQEPTPYDEHLR